MFLIPIFVMRSRESAVLVMFSLLLLVCGGAYAALNLSLPIRFHWVAICSPHFRPGVQDSAHLVTSRFILLEALFVCCAGAGIVAFVRTQRWMALVLVGFALVVFGGLAALWWPFNFVYALREKPPLMSPSERRGMETFAIALPSNWGYGGAFLC